MPMPASPMRAQRLPAHDNDCLSSLVNGEMNSMWPHVSVDLQCRSVEKVLAGGALLSAHLRLVEGCDMGSSSEDEEDVQPGPDLTQIGHDINLFDWLDHHPPWP